MAISLLDYAIQSEVPKMKGLVQQITNESVFLKRLKFIQVDGFTYAYNLQATLGGIVWRAVNEDYAASNLQPLADNVGVINPKVETIGRFGGEVKTDRAIANLPSGSAVRSSRIGSKLKKAGLFFDKYVFDGDPAVDPRQMLGINVRLTGRQVVTAGVNGAALTLAMVDDMIDRVVGDKKDKILVMNKQDRRALSALYRPSLGGTMERFIDQYEMLPIEVIDEDGDELPILAKDETVGSSNVTSSMYCFRLGSDTDEENFQGLVNTKMVEHEAQGVRGTQYIDLVEAGMGIALFHPRCAARLAGIL